MGKLALFLILLPVAELSVLGRLVDGIGGWPTFLLVLASGALGALSARAEGLRVLAQARQALSKGEAPNDSMLNSALILVGSALLIVPGVITDLLAVALFIPASRRWIAKRLIARIERTIAQGNVRVVTMQQARVDPRTAAQVIDTEGETVEADDSPKQLPRAPSA
jgi:UPF0716 protein FxsA